MTEELDIREQLVRIDKALIESDRLRQLQSAEYERLVAENRKFDAEQAELRREAWWYTIVVGISGLTAGAAILAAGAGLAALLIHLK